MLFNIPGWSYQVLAMSADIDIGSPIHLPALDFVEAAA